jgi:flagellar basal body rod protein FlgC
MANGRQRGGLGALPFPTFNTGGGKGGVIPQLNLRPAPINFPRAGGGGSRSKGVNPAAYFAPGLLSLLGDKFLPKPDIKQRQPTGDSAVDKARMQADMIYGAEREDPTLFQELLPMGLDALAAAGFGDEGGTQYAQTAINRRIANKKSERGIAAEKRAFIKEQLAPESAQSRTMIDAEKIKVGVADTRRGFFLPKEQRYKVFDPKNPKANENGFAYASDVGKGNWLDVDQTGGDSRDLSFLKDPQYEALFEFSKTQKEQDTALLSTYNAVNNVVKELDKAIDNPKLNPATTIANGLRFVDDLYANIDQVFSDRGYENVFPQTDDENSGKAAQDLWLSLKGGTDDEIDRATKALENRLNIDLSSREYLGSLAYSNIRLRSQMLSLAYAAAASAGQTGRTLSDKDLAFFLQQVGFGASQNPLALKENLLQFADDVQQKNDDRIPVFLPQRTLRQYDLENTIVQSTLGEYYIPSKNEQGEDNWLDFPSYSTRNFDMRYKDVETYKKFKSHKRGVFDGTPDSTQTEEESILDRIELFPNQT